jgi:hypothetical protein
MISVGKSRADARRSVLLSSSGILSQPRGAKLVPAAVSLFALEKQIGVLPVSSGTATDGFRGPALGTLQVCATFRSVSLLLTYRDRFPAGRFLV